MQKKLRILSEGFMNVSDHFPRFTEDFQRLLKKIWLYVDKHFLACLTFNKGKHGSQDKRRYWYLYFSCTVKIKLTSSSVSRYDFSTVGEILVFSIISDPPAKSRGVIRSLLSEFDLKWKSLHFLKKQTNKQTNKKVIYGLWPHLIHHLSVTIIN